MWTIGNFHLEIVSRPRPPYFHITNPNFYDKSGDSESGAMVTDRFENLRVRPGNNVYTVVKFYANTRLQKCNCLLTVGSNSDRLQKIRLLRSSVWHEI
jgi:hypothetical protein